MKSVDEGLKELLTPVPVVERKVIPSKPMEIIVNHKPKPVKIEVDHEDEDCSDSDDESSVK